MADKIFQQLVQIPADSVIMEGVLALPQGTRSVVIFAHGSGSSQHSRRNKFAAEVLLDAGIATLLFDLLTREEDTVYENRFDIDLVTHRLKEATIWLKAQPETSNL